MPTMVTSPEQPGWELPGTAIAPAVARRCRDFAWLAGAAGLVVGVSVLLGWWLGVAWLKSVLPGLVTMKPNTAACFVLLGLALWLRQSQASTPEANVRNTKAAGICAAVVTFVGLVTLGEHLLGFNAGIDQLLFRKTLLAIQAPHPGRMAHATALGMTLLGLGLLLLDLQTRRGHRPAQYLALGGALTGLLGVMGYIYGADALYQFTAYSTVAVHTATLLLLLGAGVLAARPESGVMAVVASGRFGGLMARRILPVVLTLPFLLGWVWLKGEEAGWYGMEFGLALFATSSAVILAVVVWLNARALNLADEERRRVDESLRQGEQRLRLATQAAGIGVFDWNVQTGVNVWTPELEVMYGLRPGEFGQTQPSWEQLVHPEDRAAATALVQRAFETHAPEQGEWRVVWRDGSVRWIAGRFQVFKDNAGRPLRITGVNVDITERKRIEAELQLLNAGLERRVAERTAELATANRELESFSYSVSHDLRAPLRGVAGFSRALAEDCASQLDERGRHYLERIRASTQRMSLLIEGLLQLAQLTRTELRRETVDMSTVAGAIADELHQSQPQRRVAFAIPPGLQASADPTLLRIVLVNLLGNAWKFTRKQPHAKIEMGAAKLDGQTTYFVRDNGVGFKPAYANKIFEAFQRLHAQQEFEGSGIGLATVQRIVQRHGGRVWAESQPGQGATFHFTLPG